MMDDLEIAANFDVSIYSKTKRQLNRNDIQEIARVRFFQFLNITKNQIVFVDISFFQIMTI